MAESCYTVIIRVRPVDETKDTKADIVFSENSILIKGNSFKFDHIFPSSSNQDVYDEAISPKLEDLFKGINVTIMAYGATGSGKTYTMGTEYIPTESNSEGGIIHRSVQYIFNKIKEEDPASYSVKISFIEVYKSDVHDLLQNEPKRITTIREDHEGFVVPNLLYVPVSSPEEVMDALKKGCNNRKTAATATNANSSRSHAVFKLFIERNEGEDVQRAKFILVDLAGSERVAVSRTDGNILKEGIGINKGLMTLRQVITALSKGPKHYAPFRNSKLTMVLKDALQGTNQTIMVACIFPKSENADETINTLRYATTAKSVVIRPKPAVSTATEIANLKKEVAHLQNLLKTSNVSQSEEILNIEGATSPVERTCVFPDINITLQNSVQQLLKMKENYAKRLRRFQERLRILKNTFETNVDINPSEVLEEVFGSDFEGDESGSFQVTNAKDEDKAFGDETFVVPELLKTTDALDEGDELDIRINEISDIMSMNCQAVKTLEEFTQTAEGIDQDLVANLTSQIQKLTDEKESLQKLVSTTVDGKGKLEKNKIENLVLEINKLKAELKEKKIILKKKEANHLEINRLKRENLDLKQLKNSLQNKIRVVGKECQQLNVEKKREIAKLMKDSSKVNSQKTKLVKKLENEICVLQTKLSKAASRTNAVKTKAVKPALKPTVKESIEDRIKIALVKQEENLVKRIATEEIRSVVSILEEQAHVAPPNLSSSISLSDKDILEKVNEAKTLVETVMPETSKEVMDQEFKKDLDCLLSSVTTVSEGKEGIAVLFKEYQAMYEKMTVEKQEESRKYHEEMNNLRDTMEAREKFYVDNLNRTMEGRDKVHDLNTWLIKEYTDFTHQLENIQTFEGERKTLETLQMQESLIAELRRIIETLQSKDEEIVSLSKDLFRAKKGKNTTWLGPVPVSIPSQEEDQTLVDEFLEESLEESFSNDQSDPDYRGTPLYKQRNKQRLARKMPPMTEDDPPPIKKSSIDVSCTCDGGRCKTMRCRCRKARVDCTIRCGCATVCFNFPSSSANL